MPCVTADLNPDAFDDWSLVARSIAATVAAVGIVISSCGGRGSGGLVRWSSCRGLAGVLCGIPVLG